MSGSMIIWNENTIKLIYEVQYITPMVILSIFGIRSIDCYRTFKGSDPNDDSDELCSNGNAPRMIEGNSNNMITRVAYALGIKLLERGS
ncbi:MAG: hypothetical protein QOK59_05280 [Nitrososphaeraceae archaeon]|nr:hypothetical protein [Nitrososphaeraceae archaeon]MDW0152395.1 hypothetical protein [Nitrososphaeraceae archaeon]MDW3654078.1 hypothetical protein [Nitrososphaeraceae archaeon]